MHGVSGAASVAEGHQLPAFFKAIAQQLPDLGNLAAHFRPRLTNQRFVLLKIRLDVVCHGADFGLTGP